MFDIQVQKLTENTKNQSSLGLSNSEIRNVKIMLLFLFIVLSFMLQFENLTGGNGLVSNSLR